MDKNPDIRETRWPGKKIPQSEVIFMRSQEHPGYRMDGNGGR
jgi:hypothetical protein